MKRTVRLPRSASRLRAARQKRAIVRIKAGVQPRVSIGPLAALDASRFLKRRRAQNCFEQLFHEGGFSYSLSLGEPAHEALHLWGDSNTDEC